MPGDRHPLTQLLPDDPHDRETARNTHPPDWVNPTPQGVYDLVVVGGGTAGLVSAGGAGLLRMRVALVERAHTGGDCLVTGCVPSKALIRAARAAHDVRDAGRFGVRVPEGVGVDFAAVMSRMRALRAKISQHDAAAAFRDGYNVDVYFGDARFDGPDAVEVAGQRLRFHRAVIATGGRPRIPDVEGLEQAGFHTSETVFNLTERPARLAVVGGGPIGCELAQAFARLGSQVTLVHQGGRLLPREDREVSRLLVEVFRREGIDVRLSAELRRVEARGGAKVLHLLAGGQSLQIEADAILLAVGRVPNVEGLNLEAAGVRYDARGVTVDDFLRTSNRRVYAVGDVCLPYQFTHAAEASAKVAVRNAIAPGRQRFSKVLVPRCTYTDPEIAHVGMTEAEGQAEWGRRGVWAQSYKLDEVDRAVTDGETDGFLRLIVRPYSQHICGATLVSRHAGETISQVTTAMVGGMGLKKLADVVFPYPTQAEAIKKAVDHYQQWRVTSMRHVIYPLWRLWLAWLRRG